MIDVHIRRDTDTGDKRGSRDRRDVATNQERPGCGTLKEAGRSPGSTTLLPRDFGFWPPLPEGVSVV